MTTSDGTWTQIELRGHACDVYEPPRFVSTPQAERRGAVIYLHGVRLARLADYPVFTEEFARHNLAVLAPHSGPSWWTDRITPGFDLQITPVRQVLDQVLPYAAERWGIRPPQLALLGTSMGGQGALRLAFKNADKFPVVAAISPAIDYQIRWREGDPVLRQLYDDAETARQDTATLHVHPLHWPRHLWFCCDPADARWHDSADRLRMKLAALGIPHETDLSTSAGGHGWEYYQHMAPRAVAFLADSLDRERRRVN
ncbi:MAG TPA: alpha/beta hydrolase-fold protein [Pirellulales bacterium]|jgi:pimeloyl-ACP methyl ester carboxylesterase|nr:alpha/beta hydrolase-fold protein [Pirellulales bacterium]